MSMCMWLYIIGGRCLLFCYSIRNFFKAYADYDEQLIPGNRSELHS